MADFKATPEQWELLQRLADALQPYVASADEAVPAKVYYSQKQQLIDKARALAQPAAEGPTVMEIIALADKIEEEELGQVDLVRRALVRWGHQPCPYIRQGDSGSNWCSLAEQGRQPPAPVPVSERQPTAADCDSEGRCWLFHVGMDGVGDWHRRAPYPIAASYQFFRTTHWLPHWALPVPTNHS